MNNNFIGFLKEHLIDDNDFLDKLAKEIIMSNNDINQSIIEELRELLKLKDLRIKELEILLKNTKENLPNYWYVTNPGAPWNYPGYVNVGVGSITDTKC